MDHESFIAGIVTSDVVRNRSAQEIEGRQRRIQDAYSALSKNPHWQLVLEDLTYNVLLKPCDGPEQEGERRLVLKLLAAMKAADAAIERR